MSAITADPWTLPGGWQQADALAWRPDPAVAWTPPAAEAEGGVGEWLLGAIAGEWADDQSLGQIAVDFGLSVVPVVDQVSDVRDLSAHVYRLGFKGEHTQPGRWVSLAFTLIGLIPGAGSVIKSASKFAIKGVKELIAHLDEILAMGRRAGVPFPDVRALARWVSAHWAKVQTYAQRYWDQALGLAAALATNVPAWLGRNEVLKVFTDLVRLTPRFLPRALAEIRRLLDDVLGRADRELAPLRTDALNTKVAGEEVWGELAQDLGTKPARVLPNWTIPGNWKQAKPAAYKLIFGTKTLPDINRPGAIEMTLGHIVEKATGGTHSLENLMPQLMAVNRELAAIYARKELVVRLPNGDPVVIRALHGKKIEGPLRDAFAQIDPKTNLPVFSADEQRAMSNYLLTHLLAENPLFEQRLAELIQKIPKLADEIE